VVRGIDVRDFSVSPSGSLLMYLKCDPGSYDYELCKADGSRPGKRYALANLKWRWEFGGQEPLFVSESEVVYSMSGKPVLGPPSGTYMYNIETGRQRLLTQRALDHMWFGYDERATQGRR
jgi:hypothetical protein